MGLSPIGLIPNGDGEYLILLSDVELKVEEKSLAMVPVERLPVYIGSELGMDKFLMPAPIVFSLHLLCNSDMIFFWS